MEVTCSSETLIFNGLCNVISQKIELFIKTAVRMTNPIIYFTLIEYSFFQR
jgi:hypothetical protein